MTKITKIYLNTKNTWNIYWFSIQKIQTKPIHMLSLGILIYVIQIYM